MNVDDTSSAYITINKRAVHLYQLDYIITYQKVIITAQPT